MFTLKLLNKRGLSPSELELIDPELFEYMMIYDSSIEPSGSRFEHIKYSNLAHLILMSSGNLTEAGMKRASVNDWDMYGLLSNKTVHERIQEQDEAEQAKQQLQNSAMMNFITGGLRNGTE
ncbi:hypothetical protein [Leclercia sp. GLN_9]|uniref:hypothetical protein n=1 Tax=Leclercia sp. GLN_9 TaxID=3367184 RepID=UPI00370CC196